VIENMFIELVTVIWGTLNYVELSFCKLWDER
jgi:hypothetical protein